MLNLWYVSVQAIVAPVLKGACIWYTMYFQLGCRDVVNKDEWAVVQALNCQSVLIHKSFVHKSGRVRVYVWVCVCVCVSARLQRGCIKARTTFNWNVYEIQITFSFSSILSLPALLTPLPLSSGSLSQLSSDVKNIFFCLRLSYTHKNKNTFIVKARYCGETKVRALAIGLGDDTLKCMIEIETIFTSV